MEKKEAMKILKEFHDKSALFSVRTALDTVIPELAESEDEKIIKDIISFLHSKNGYMNPDEDWDFHNRWLPWFEKQGKVKESLISQHDNKICKENDSLFPELAESDGERIRKELYKYFRDLQLSSDREFSPSTNIDEILAWLEKQGEKESDPRYENLEEILAADDIYQMSMNDEMVQEAKEKAVNALSGMCIGRLLGLEKQGEKSNIHQDAEDDLRRQSTIRILEYARSLDAYNQYGKESINKDIAWLEKQSEISSIIYNSSNIGKNEHKCSWSEEDDKIRKALIELVKYEGGSLKFLDNPFDDVPMDTMLDWLEKQGDRREQLINKACDVLVNCIEDYMFRNMEVWNEECKKQTLENIRKTLEE